MELKKEKAIELIEHMTGCSKWKRTSSHGLRNYFCAEIGSEDYDHLIEMEKNGLVSIGFKINQGKDQYFHATLEGCQFANLSKKALKRIFEEE